MKSGFNEMSRKHNTQLNSVTEMGQKFCEACRHDIPADEPEFHCFTYGVQFHLTEACINLSKGPLNGIMELGKNALLLFQACVTSKQRNNLKETASKIQQPKKNKKIGQLQSKVAEIKKVITEIKVGVDNKASISTRPPQNQSPSRPPPIPQHPTQPERFGVRGVPESSSKLALEINKHDMA